MSDSCSIAYDLSPWALRELSGRIASGYERRSRWACPTSQLTETLTNLGLPATEELLGFEQNLGGWSRPEPESLWGLGIGLSLGETAECHGIAKRIRKHAGWFARDTERQEGPREWSHLPMHGTGYPRAFFRDRALVPAGMTGEEHVYFVGARGEVYLFLVSQDQLLLTAGSGRTLIERWGMLGHRSEHAYVELHICANVGPLVARTLGVPLFTHACDDYFTVWANDTVQLRLVHDVAPNIFGTHIAVRNPEQLLLAVREVMAQHEWRSLRVWAAANNVDDLGGRTTIENAGIELQTLFGPGPGNFEYTIDPDSGEETFVASTYDSSGWTGNVPQHLGPR